VKSAYTTRAKRASTDAKKIAHDAAALNKDTEAKLAAALKEIETLKTEAALKAWAEK